MNDDSLSLEDYEAVIKDLVANLQRFQSANVTLGEVGETLTSAAKQFINASQQMQRLAGHTSEAVSALQSLDPAALHTAVRENAATLTLALAKHDQATADWHRTWESAHQDLKHHVVQGTRELAKQLAPIGSAMSSVTQTLNTLHQQQTTHHEMAARQVDSANQSLQELVDQVKILHSHIGLTREQAEHAAQASTQAAQNAVGMTSAMINEVYVPIAKKLRRLWAVSVVLLLINAMLSITVLALMLRS